VKKVAQIVALTTIALALTTGHSLSLTTREAIMHKCNAQTLKHVRKGGVNYENRRALVWKDCMHSHGQRP
jgi:hypothetical protein